MRTAVASRRSTDAIPSVVRAYLLGLLSARIGDDTAALAHASRLDALAAGQGRARSEYARAMAHDLAFTVRAELARRRGEPAEALALLERARPDRWYPVIPWISPIDGLSYERWMRAELLAALGRDAEALDWYAGIGVWGPGTESSLVPARLVRVGEIYERLGQREEAVAQYTAFVALWRECDPELRPIVDDVRRRILRLGGQVGEGAP